MYIFHRTMLTKSNYQLSNDNKNYLDERLLPIYSSSQKMNIFTIQNRRYNRQNRLSKNYYLNIIFKLITFKNRNVMDSHLD